MFMFHTSKINKCNSSVTICSDIFVCITTVKQVVKQQYRLCDNPSSSDFI